MMFTAWFTAFHNVGSRPVETNAVNLKDLLNTLLFWVWGIDAAPGAPPQVLRER